MAISEWVSGRVFKFVHGIVGYDSLTTLANRFTSEEPPERSLG